MNLSLPSAVLLSLMLHFCAAPAYAAAPGPGRSACGDRGKIAAALARTYEETVTARGISARGALVEIFSSKRGTWTLVVTVPGGPSCLVAAGRDWTGNIPVDKPKRPAPKERGS